MVTCTTPPFRAAVRLNSSVRQHMKSLAIVTAIVTAMSLCGCQTIYSEDQALCSRIADFANSIDDSVTHSVELTTDWSGQFVEKTRGEFVAGRKNCTHFGYQPGARLCEYLIGHTSTEFPDANVNSVLVCLGAGRPTKMVYDLEYGTTVLWSHVTRGVRGNVLVGIDYSIATDSTPDTLKISARQDL